MAQVRNASGIQSIVVAFLLCAGISVAHADERTQRLKDLVEERAAVSASESPESKALRAEPPSSGISGIRVVEGMLLTLGVFFLGVWGYQKMNGHSMPKLSSRRMKVIERISVGSKTSLVLAEIDGRSVLLSVGGERVAFFSDSAWLEGAWEKEQQAHQQSSPG